MKKHLRYLWYVLRHKWFVFVECCKSGIPLRGIFHDWTKFLPVEWSPYVNYFYGEWRNGNLNRQAVAPPDIQEAFERAWNHHQKRNDHHWQYWVRLGDDGTYLTLDMPEQCRHEMLADWHGAGRTLGKPDTAAWYASNCRNQKLHPTTRMWIEEQLGHKVVFKSYCQPQTDGKLGEFIRVNTIGGEWAPNYDIRKRDIPAVCGHDVKKGQLYCISECNVILDISWFRE